MEMNQHTKQQNLELFIQEVINYLKKNFNYIRPWGCSVLGDVLRAGRCVGFSVLGDVLRAGRCVGFAIRHI